MKKLLTVLSIIASIIILNSCSSAKEVMSGNTESTSSGEDEIREAIVSRRFIIKLDRIYTYGFIDLRPRSNYIIVDGNKAVINAAYLGRQYSSRPVAGINMRGIASEYVVTNKVNQGKYNIKMRVENQNSSFDVYLTIGKNGDADAAVNGLRIDNIRYRGYVVPLSKKIKTPAGNYEMI